MPKVTIQMIPKLNPWQLARIRKSIEADAAIYDINPWSMPEPVGTVAADMYWKIVDWYDDVQPSSNEYLENHTFYQALMKEIKCRKALGIYSIPLQKT